MFFTFYLAYSAKTDNTVIMDRLPTQSAPARFYEIRLGLKFATKEAKQRLVDQIMREDQDEVQLGALMLLLNKEAKVKFPKKAALPIVFKDIRDITEDDVPDLLDGNRIDLTASTDDAWWVMDFVENEPRRVGDFSHDELI